MRFFTDMIRSLVSAVRPAPQPHGDHQDPAGNVDELDPEESTPYDAPTLVPLEVDVTGWLVGDRVRKVPSRRQQDLATAGAVPVMVVWHWTATRGNVEKMVKRIVERPHPDDPHGASWHLCIQRDGTIWQSVPFNRGSWHAGGASSARFIKDHLDAEALALNGWRRATPSEVKAKRGVVSANALSIGVEMECVGEVRHVNGKFIGWPFEPGESPVVPADEVSELVHTQGDRARRYHVFSPAQVIAAERLVRALVARYPKLTQAGLSYGHIDLDPSRKSDPGPIWRREQLPAILRRCGVVP